MDVIWEKNKSRTFSKESLISQKLASGDCVKLQCRLCGASEDHLQHITDNQLDEKLSLHFGVQVPPEGVICNACIKCLKITENFTALVHASFNKKTISQETLRNSRILATFSPGTTNLAKIQKEMLPLLTTETCVQKSLKRQKTRNSITKTNSKLVFRKTIVACTVCGQKYHMFMQADGVKTYVCPRCLKKKGSGECKKKVTQSSVHKNELRCKYDLNERSRLNSLPDKPQQVNQNHSAWRFYQPKHKCSQCPKKYTNAENLATHVKTMHEGSSNCICPVCGKKLLSKDNLEKHLREHKGVNNFQCPECKKVYRCNRALQTHRIYHDNQKKTFRS